MQVFQKFFKFFGLFLLAGLLLCSSGAALAEEESFEDEDKGMEDAEEIEEEIEVVEKTEEEKEESDDQRILTAERVVTLGANLNSEQRKDMLDYFGVNEDEVLILEVTNPEEYAYLEGIAGSEVIGSRAISSVYLELQPQEEGINVETHHITWVTSEMYATSMVTAGVSDVRIVAAAPFPVSGTAALTGVVKAFEEVTGKELAEKNKQVAHEELLILSQLAEETEESEQTTELMQRAKEEILENRPLDYEEIEAIVRQLAEEIDLELTEEQIERLSALLEKFNELDLDLDHLRRQITDFIDDPDNRSLITKVLEILSEIIDQVINQLLERFRD